MLRCPPGNTPPAAGRGKKIRRCWGSKNVQALHLTVWRNVSRRSMCASGLDRPTCPGGSIYHLHTPPDLSVTDEVSHPLRLCRVWLWGGVFSEQQKTPALLDLSPVTCPSLQPPCGPGSRSSTTD